MNFCTIITPGYIHYALSLRESLLQFNQSVHFYILVSEFQAGLKERIEREFDKTYLIYAEEICKEGVAKAIYEKYASTYTDGFRWSIKPVLLMYLMQTRGIDKIIYTDCDIRFYSDYQFLFDELGCNNVLLTPHWRTSDPHLDETHFISMYTSGLYNAGFIAVNLKAFKALEWWAKANLYICEINASKGQFVDQTHLNLFHIYFDGVKSLKHRGCNVAGWNMLECRRTPETDGSVTINNQWPVVFVHFSNHTIHAIKNGEDKLLEPHLATYQKRIQYFAAQLGISVPEEAPPPKREQTPARTFASLVSKLINKGAK